MKQRTTNTKNNSNSDDSIFDSFTSESDSDNLISDLKKLSLNNFDTIPKKIIEKKSAPKKKSASNPDSLEETPKKIIEKKSASKKKSASNPDSLEETPKKIIEKKLSLDNSNITLEKIIKNKYILEPSAIPLCINMDILREYVRKDIDGNKEYFDDLNITYKISSPSKAEWILNKAILNGILVGAGNTSVDILTANVCIDVTVLTLNNSCTNEKSIMQNFSTGNNLDSLFNDNKGGKIVEIFKDKLIEKYVSYEKKEIYYAVFVCHKKNIYLVCFQLIPKNINNMEYASFSKSNKNILIDNFIDETYGNVKLYKSKKRLELRLCKDIIHLEHSIKIF